MKQQGKAEGIFSTADTKAEMPSTSVQPEQTDILISKCNRQSLFCVVFVAVVCVCACRALAGDLYFSPNS